MMYWKKICKTVWQCVAFPCKYPLIKFRFSASLCIGVALLILPSCRVTQTTKPIAQTECDSLFFDLDTGMVNSVSPMLPQDDVKQWFTCYTHSYPDGAPGHCGGGAVYRNHGFYYNTYFDFVQVSSDFKGHVSYGLLNADSLEVHRFYPNRVYSALIQDSSNVDLVPMNYGCLVFEYQNGKTGRISAYFTECTSVDLCELSELKTKP